MFFFCQVKYRRQNPLCNNWHFDGTWLPDEKAGHFFFTARAPNVFNNLSGCQFSGFFGWLSS